MSTTAQAFRFGWGTYATLIALSACIAALAFTVYKTGTHETQRSETYLPAVPSKVATEKEFGQQGTATANASRPREQPEPEASAYNPVLQQQVLRERASELDNNFLNDPVSAWAKPMETRIANSIASSGYLEEGEYGIAGYDVQCRTGGCRIGMRFTEDTLSDEAMMMLRADIADELPRTLTVRLTKPDGSYDYRIYATKESAAAQLFRKRTANTPQDLGDNPKGI
jgi:hypothetical protein